MPKARTCSMHINTSSQVYSSISGPECMHKTYIGVDWYGGIKPKTAYYHTAIVIYMCKQALTRQLSYRKEDRAMRPIYGCP